MLTRHRLPIGAPLAALTVLALTGPALLAAPAAQALAPAKAAAGAQKFGDVDGDGFDDLVAGAPDAAAGGDAKAGYVAAAYGAARGLDLDRHQQLTQSSPGVPGTPEPGDRFGSALAVADVDGDGYADLVAGASGEAIGTVKAAGSVTVVFGSASGLSDHAIAFHPATPVANQHFGGRIAVGDYNHDGREDIAVGAGAKVALVYGAANLRSTATPRITSITPPGGGAGVTGLTAGDVNGDGYSDLVTTAYFDDPADEGTLGVLPGSSDGLKTTPLGQPTGLPFADYDAVVGDVNGDGKDDVVLDTGFSDGPDDFRLRTLPGSASGLDSAHPVLWKGEVPDGTAAVLSDFDGDGHADLVVSDTHAPDSDGIQGAGALTVLKGSADWLTAEGARRLTLDTPGVAGVSEGNNRFGTALASADYNGDDAPDLASGVPGEDAGNGAVSVLYAGEGGLTPTGSILIRADYLDIPIARDGLGTTLGVPPRR